MLLHENSASKIAANETLWSYELTLWNGNVSYCAHAVAQASLAAIYLLLFPLPLLPFLLSYRLSLCRSVLLCLFFVCLFWHSFSFHLSMFPCLYLYCTHICILVLMGSQWYLTYIICPSCASLVLVFAVFCSKAHMISRGSQEMKNSKEEQKEKEKLVKKHTQ